MNKSRTVVLMCEVLAAIAMACVPPWRDLHVPPFGSGESFGGYSPIYWPPHHPWTIPALAHEPFWNAQHEYRVNWWLLAIQEAAALAITIAAFIAAGRKRGQDLSLPSGPVPFFGGLAGACLGGLAALLIGLIGVTAAMAPLLEVAPAAIPVTTALMLAVYLGTIVVAIALGANRRLGSVVRVLACLVAGQLAVAYTLFVALPDASPASHRVFLLVWLTATGMGAVAGLVWVRWGTRGRWDAGGLLPDAGEQ